VREWQIWNEQNAPWYWARRPWAASYTKVLKAAYQAVHSRDSGADVIAGSVIASSAKDPPWNAMRDLYRAGARPYFDSAAVHPFTNDPRSVSNTVSQTLEIVRRVRQEMRRNRDAKKPIHLTEMTWTAAAGKIPKGGMLGFETTAAGQAQRLTAAYRALSNARLKLGIGKAYWYNWASEYDKNQSRTAVTFRYTGLTRWSGSGAFAPLPLLNAYAKVAAQLEGCAKGADARSCR